MVPREQAQQEKHAINLKTGWPAPSLLPAKALLAAAQNVLSDPTVSSPALTYGANDEGLKPVREELAKWLNTFYEGATRDYAQSLPSPQSSLSGPIQPDFSRIVITAGASQSLGCVLREVTDPSYTRNVWIVAPAYFLAFKIFEDAGLKMRAVPEGKGVEWLRGEMKAVEDMRREELRRSGESDCPVSSQMPS